MKIKVFILFSILFLGIGFDGFGQCFDEDEDFNETELQVDTVKVSFIEKIQIIKKCENLGVDEEGVCTWNNYGFYVNEDSSISYQAGFCPTSKILLLDTKNNKIIDMIIQPTTRDLGEGKHACIWTLNGKGEYKSKKLFEGGSIKKIYRDKNILKIDIQLSGCCDNYFMCDETYAYENDSLILKKQICYLKKDRYVKGATELKENGIFVTVDSAYLIGNNPRGYGDFVEMVDYTTDKDSIMQYDYDDEIIAVVSPNQKGRVLATRFVDGLYWYLIVFPPQSIQRRVFDYMIGEPDTQLHFAGWIKSKIPLKIKTN
ncbi:hypothetical protein V9L05_11365 [Bernardetia sp. Wsw4-3y2]|uniref:hypothetical protein n=1 Tax=Bernardetia sp. Wsw4-3y2 TaxID=3127471 RepID=UPI0030CEF6C1